MKSYLYGEIVPGERVGEFYFGSTLEKVKQQIDFDYSIEETPDTLIIEGESITFFFSKEGILLQITVHGGYKGKFLGKIGIGAILADTKEFLRYKMDDESNDCEFILPDYQGIIIYLEGWSNERTPITHISVTDYKLIYEDIVEP